DPHPEPSSFSRLFREGLGGYDMLSFGLADLDSLDSAPLFPYPVFLAAPRAFPLGEHSLTRRRIPALPLKRLFAALDLSIEINEGRHVGQGPPAVGAHGL